VVPPEIVDALAAGRRPRVRVTINNHTYRSTIAVRGGQYLLGVSAENRRRMTSGVQQHHGNEHRDRDKSDREEQDEVPLMASRLGVPCRLGGQLRQVGGQDGKVV
jgi:Domain of unknown function (DUF1905)